MHQPAESFSLDTLLNRHLESLSSGVKPGVHIYEGAACEFILSFISCIIIIYSMGAITGSDSNVDALYCCSCTAAHPAVRFFPWGSELEPAADVAT